VRAQFAGIDVPGLLEGVHDDGRVEIEVPRADVARVVGVLAEADAQDLTCAPATLEDLFLGHYEVAAR
jgi:ABC-2 type transport system ATP-binding protein